MQEQESIKIWFKGMTIFVQELINAGWVSEFQGKEIEFEMIQSDTRQIKKGDIFFAFDGGKFRGVDFVQDAIIKGVSAIFIDKKYIKQLFFDKPDLLNFPVFFGEPFTDLAGKTLALLYGNPCEKIQTIGITGTNGKTSIAYNIKRVLQKIGKKSFYMGTLGVITDGAVIDLGMTTPPLTDVYRYLNEARQGDCEFAAIEASSHGLQQNRLNSIAWSAAVFTNLTRDHLDYHVNMENYFDAKKILFFDILRVWKENPSQVKGVVINIDDIYGGKLAEFIKNENPDFPLITLGKGGVAQLINVEPLWNGYRADLTIDGETIKLRSKVIGSFSIWNQAVVYLILRLFDIDKEKLLEAIEGLENVPGRMEIYPCGSGYAVIDYAHTPDALYKALETLKELKPSAIKVVFGCGGDRDRTKREPMGKIASDLADEIILTNDNPRSENPELIISEIKQGIKNVHSKVILDRESAIRTALSGLLKDEVLLIAGKGHENYQIIGKEKKYFSDKDVVLKFVKEQTDE